MKEHNHDMSVDAGNISVIGPDTIKKYGLRYQGKKRDYSSMFFTVKAQKDDTIFVAVSDTEDGIADGLETPKRGTYYVGDACYIIKKWNKFLEDTDFLKKMPEDCLTIDTGGDGLFNVRAGIF